MDELQGDKCKVRTVTDNIWGKQKKRLRDIVYKTDFSL